VTRSQGATRATSRHHRSFDLLPWGLTPTVSARPSDHQPAFDPVAERLVDIGRHLREARQQRGEDLYDVADYLRIKPSYLFALEEGDLAGMPGRTYAMGFLRTYADHLGYDGAEVVRQLKTTGEPEANLEVRQPVAENRLPSLGVVVLALVLAAVAYGGWFAAQSGDDVLARIKALPGEIGQYAAAMFEDEPAAPMTASIEAPDGPDAAPLEVFSATADASRGTSVVASASSPANPVGNAAGAIGGVQAGEVPRATAAARPAAGGVDMTAVIADRRAGAGAAASDIEDPLAALVLDAEAERAEALRRLQATPGDAVGGNGEAPAVTVVSDTGRITLVAREASWIQVQSPGRDFLRSTTLQPGQRFDLPDRTDLALWTGNAGGLEVWVDGRNLGVLGASGAVMRDVPLTPEALRARL